MSELETRKKLLAAESEVYRELLKLEIQNFKIYTRQTQRKLSVFQTCLPALVSGLPMVTSFFGRRRRSTFKQLSSLLFLGWKAYSKLGPLWRGRVRRPRHTAAEDYLTKRI